MKWNKQNLQKGETLLEALVALALVAIVITAIANVVTVSLNNAQYNENQTLATKYAQHGMLTMLPLERTMASIASVRVKLHWEQRNQVVQRQMLIALFVQ
jgi:Tfp pilus assembly protein PilV